MEGGPKVGLRQCQGDCHVWSKMGSQSPHGQGGPLRSKSSGRMGGKGKPQGSLQGVPQPDLAPQGLLCLDIITALACSAWPAVTLFRRAAMVMCC